MAHQDEPSPILFVIDHFRNPNAGTEGQLFQLIKGLDRARFKPRLLVFRDSEYLEKQGFPCDYQILGKSRMASPSTWFALWKAARDFRKEGGRLAHIFFNDPSVLCPPIFRLCGIKCIISRRDMGYWYTKPYLVMLAVTGRFVSLVVTNSQAVKEVTLRKEPIPPSRIQVVHNGYENTISGSSVPEDLASLRKEYSGAVFAGIVANIRPIKRIADAIRALRVLCQEGVDLHLIVIGDGNSSALKRLAAELEVDDARVHFLGARDDAKNCLSALDIGLLCSESEGFSNAIVEYMQAGLPVVCSNVGGNPEAVKHGEHGYLYPCGDIETMAMHLNVLVNDAALRKSMGAKARTYAEKSFGMNAMVNRHQEIYADLVAQGGQK
ncbi:glycosyltransferase [Marinobacter panjinensis]|uniref:Glycosyltransferase n=1 Tax=Marinobacter panjinensis TaxID=2576384 RepID=A0A4U6R0S4_9GAMM|nr:glycosyltransferase [Marinobacter panjinensis]MCR8915816.1 glycosyltransferase [Marinobacter panjinensis]TKV67207.1 glycosyltransferase [Marinobacter panjinensis]